MSISVAMEGGEIPLQLGDEALRELRAVCQLFLGQPFSIRSSFLI